MSKRLEGKLALVTAAGQGIGRAIAEAFISEGAKVIATDIALDKLDGLKAAKCAKLDVLSTPDVEAFAQLVAKDFGALNVLANVAGYVHQGTVLDCSEKDWDFSFDLNVKSMHRTIKAFLPGMLKNVVGCLFDQRPAQALRLWRDQGGRDRPDQSNRRRLHHQRHPLQRHLSRHHRVSLAR
jgi:2-keto-3-deoxy-L-fuconate dehydrogenase